MATDASAGTPEPTGNGRERRWLRPLAYTLLGAVVAAAVFVVVDRSGGSGSDQAAPSTTAATTTTLAPAIAGKVYRTIQPSLVLIQSDLGGTEAGSTSLGSGVIINAQGQVMTAEHVIDQATSIDVTYADGSHTPAQVVSSTPDRDIAVLQPESPPRVIVPAVLGGGVRVGDDTLLGRQPPRARRLDDRRGRVRPGPQRSRARTAAVTSAVSSSSMPR